MLNKLPGLSEKSVVTTEQLVDWKKSKNQYNFDTLPDTAILTVFPRDNSISSYFKHKPVKGIKGKNYLVKDKKIVLCTQCGYGAPHIVSLCEELRALGVLNFIFVGLAGSIDGAHQEGELLFVEKTLSGVGASYYYSEDEQIEPQADEWLNDLTRGLDTKPATCWSTDAPFRESRSLIKHYQEKGANVVEMECAAIYAFAKYHDLNACCFVLVSDQLTDQWHLPQDYPELAKKGQETLTKITELV